MRNQTACALDQANTTLKRSLHEALSWCVIELSGSRSKSVDEVSWVAKQVRRANEFQNVALDVGHVVLDKEILHH